MKIRSVIRTALLVLACCTGQAATAQVADLQLVLAVDTSGSVDQRRFELQKQGYVAAFRNPRVLAAIGSGRNQSIAVTMTQWTGPAQQVQVVPWTLLGDAASIARFAAMVEETPRQLYFGGTSVSGAIDHAMTLFPSSPYKAERQVIDISGDGANNRGRSVNAARDEAVAAGAVINGLPITALEPDLEAYYRDNVIGGSGAFVIATENYENFADAILRKLIAEIAGKSPSSPGQSFAELTKSAGTPQFPGLTIVYLSPLGNAAATRWKHILVHQTEGPAGSARNGAAEQAKNPTRRGVTLWVETDGIVYWALPENVVPLQGDGANRNDIGVLVDLQSADLKIQADKTMIEQVLINLIKNAIQAFDAQTGKKILLSAYDNDGHVIISVKDNGNGIDADAMERIFVPFFTTKKTGSGIGLSLSRQIMRQHGGQITVKSKLGEGTEFLLRF